MKKQKQLKKQLGSQYSFTRHLSTEEVSRLLKDSGSGGFFRFWRPLTVGGGEAGGGALLGRRQIPARL